MHDIEALKALPAARRPRMIPLFPLGTPCFRTWRSLRWFLLLLLPVIASAASAGLRHELGISLGVGLVGALLALCLFITLCSGLASSNWGTYFRQTEPKRYWSQIAFLAIAYLIFLGLGFALPLSTHPNPASHPPKSDQTLPN